MKMNGELNSTSLELLGKANELSNKVSAIIISKERKYIEALSNYGIDVIYYIDEDIENYEIKSQVIMELVKKYKPKTFLFPKTFYGKIISAFIAAKLNTGLSADCIDLKIDDNNKLVQKRVAYGGNLMAEIICPDAYPQIATISPNVFKININKDKKCKIIKIENKKEYKTNLSIIKIMQENTEKVEEARVIVAGGAGVKTKEKFSKLNELSTLLSGGVVGATRNAVDMGLVSYKKQIGQSAIITNTDLYIACGISGAIEHVVGINSKIVIAINNDINAPIFKYADYGIVSDLEMILDKIIEKLKER